MYCSSTSVLRVPIPLAQVYNNYDTLHVQYNLYTEEEVTSEKLFTAVEANILGFSQDTEVNTYISMYHPVNQ